MAKRGFMKTTPVCWSWIPMMRTLVFGSPGCQLVPVPAR